MHWPRKPARLTHLTDADIKDVRDRLADMMIVLRAFDERLQAYSESQHEQEGDNPGE